MSSTEDQWDQAYFGARKLISTYLTKVEKLDAIYKNPEYHSGYFLRKIPCNMKLRGSTPAEQNHSSIIAMGLEHPGQYVNILLNYLNDKNFTTIRLVRLKIYTMLQLINTSLCLKVN